MPEFYTPGENGRRDSKTSDLDDGDAMEQRCSKAVFHGLDFLTGYAKPFHE